MPRSINLIVIHCSATPSGQPLQRGKPGQPGFLNAADVIDGWHRERGFKRNPAAAAGFNPRLQHIGYHYVVDVSGQVWTGRHIDEFGAHAKTHNANSVSICLVGGAERSARYTVGQWRTLATLTRLLASEQGVPLRAPVKQFLADGSLDASYGVCGHRELSPDKDGDGLIESFEWLKTCPGFSVADWLSTALTPEPEHIFPAGTRYTA